MGGIKKYHMSTYEQLIKKYDGTQKDLEAYVAKNLREIVTMPIGKEISKSTALDLLEQMEMILVDTNALQEYLKIHNQNMPYISIESIEDKIYKKINTDEFGLTYRSPEEADELQVIAKTAFWSNKLTKILSSMYMKKVEKIDDRIPKDIIQENKLAVVDLYNAYCETGKIDLDIYKKINLTNRYRKTLTTTPEELLEYYVITTGIERLYAIKNQATSQVLEKVMTMNEKIDKQEEKISYGINYLEEPPSFFCDIPGMNVPLSVHLKDQYHIQVLEKVHKGQRLPQYGNGINIPSPVFFELNARDIKDTQVVCKNCLHERTFIEQTGDRIRKYKKLERVGIRDER